MLAYSLHNYFQKCYITIVERAPFAPRQKPGEQGGLSLRFPVFKRVRDDKDEESYE
jgi:hypothetical protein